MRYIALIEKEPDSCYGVFFPDFPGCVSTGDTVEEAIQMAGEALALHAEGIEEDEEALPQARGLEEIACDPDFGELVATARVVYVPLIRDLGSPKRVNVSLDCGLLQAIDLAARERGMTRSAFLSSAARKEIQGGG